MVNIIVPLLIVACIDRVSSFHASVKKIWPHSGDSKRKPISPLSPATHSLNLSPIHRHQLYAGGSEEEEKDYQSTRETQSSESVQEELSFAGKAEVIGYRTALVFASLGFAVSAAASLLEGTGLNTETIKSLHVDSQAARGWGSCLTVNEALPTLGSFALIIELINAIQWNLSTGEVPAFSLTSSENLDKAAGLFMAAICCREILLYGVAFKIEAVLAIVFIILQALDLGLSQAVCLDGLALSLLVLSVGKVFEPIGSDLRPNQSSFFLDGQ